MAHISEVPTMDIIPNQPSVMIANYHWMLKDIENQPKILISEMLPFRGENIFRVGLKNGITRNESSQKFSSVFLIAINLHKIGLRINEVLVCSEKITSAVVMEDTNEPATSMQLFTLELVSSTTFTGQQTFIFEIHLQSESNELSYSLDDSSFKSQLWEACSKGILWPDVTFEVSKSGVQFKAHKAILSARSSVLAAKLLQMDENTSSAIIRLDGVDNISVETFLKFLYTGVLEGSLACKELLDLAVMFNIPALEKNCRRALEDVEINEVARLAIMFDNYKESYPVVRIREKSCPVNENSDVVLHCCEWLVEKMPSSGETKESEVFSYEGWPLCIALIKNASIYNPNTGYYDDSIVVTLFSNVFSGCKVKEAQYCLRKVQLPNQQNQAATQNPSSPNKWIKLNSNNQDQKEVASSIFWTTLSATKKYAFHLCFRLKIMKKVKDHKFSMMDVEWSKNLLNGCFGQFADVEVLCGSKKFFAHRLILALRSPVLRDKFNTESIDHKAKINLEEVDPSTVLKFMRFLYTGTLPRDALEDRDQLEELAKKYEVDSLVKWLSSMAPLLSVEDVVLDALSPKENSL